VVSNLSYQQPFVSCRRMKAGLMVSADVRVLAMPLVTNLLFVGFKVFMN
jgi:hypothetical protein